MSTQQTSQDNPLAGFGPNEWIVEEMYQRYLADPASVDPAWHDFFADYRPAPTAPATRAAPADRGHAGRREPDGQPTRRSAGRRRQPQPRRPPRSRPPPKPASARQAGRRRSRRSPRRRRPPRPSRPPKPTAPSAGGAQTTPLRGVAAKIVQNMDASLAVPTATSVRAVPAKLLVDNRIVINNHLARGPRRQGQLHPPHRVRAGPGAGRAPGDEQLLRRGRRQAGDGPARSTSTSASPSTWPSRTAPAPGGAVHQGLRADGLPAVLAGVRGRGPARPPQRADHGRLRRHHDLADQPGRHRHRALACRG